MQGACLDYTQKKSNYFALQTYFMPTHTTGDFLQIMTKLLSHFPAKLKTVNFQ